MIDVLKQAVEVIKQWHGPLAWNEYFNHAPEMKIIREALEADESDLVTPHLKEAMGNSVAVLLNAIEAEENPDQQIAYRKMAATGNYDSTEHGQFQVIVELCVDRHFFMEDGDITIITDPTHQSEPYKT